MSYINKIDIQVLEKANYNVKLYRGINIFTGKNGVGKSFFLELVGATLLSNYYSHENLSYILDGIKNHKELSRLENKVEDLEKTIKRVFQLKFQNKDKSKKRIGNLKFSIRITFYNGAELTISTKSGNKLEIKKAGNIEDLIPILCFSPDQQNFDNQDQAQAPDAAIKFNNLFPIIINDDFLSGKANNFGVNQVLYDLGKQYYNNEKELYLILSKSLNTFFSTKKSKLIVSKDNIEEPYYTIEVFEEDNEIINVFSKGNGILSVIYIVSYIYFCLKISTSNEKSINLGKAIIIINEADIYLNSDRRSKLIEILKKHFPNVQFLISTNNQETYNSMDDFFEIEKPEGKPRIIRPQTGY